MKFKCDNKDCMLYNKTEFNYPVVKIKYKEQGKIYTFENGNEIICPNCGKPLSYIEEFKGYGKWLGSFDSRTPQEKKEILKKRARQHDKTDKKLKEYKQYLDNGGTNTKY